ncbi:hypothetical protein EV368DRAFT_69758 [Lentinula lateritia]|nr:hypothetical protein EV368DRAFT_69758 [Lentinula lateritia]
MISPSSGSCPHPNYSVTSSAPSEAPTYPLVSIQLPFTPNPVLQPPVYPYTSNPQRPASSALTTPQLVASAPRVLHPGVLPSSPFPVGTVWYRALPPIPGNLCESRWKYTRWQNAQAENFTLSTYLDDPACQSTKTGARLSGRDTVRVPAESGSPLCEFYGEGNLNHWPIFYWNWHATIGLKSIVLTVHMNRSKVHIEKFTIHGHCPCKSGSCIMMSTFVPFPKILLTQSLDDGYIHLMPPNLLSLSGTSPSPLGNLLTPPPDLLKPPPETQYLHSRLPPDKPGNSSTLPSARPHVF